MKNQIRISRPSIPAVIWVLAGLTVVALPLRLVSYGYLPPDDALRHAAKVVSGKSWSEILVMRPDITIDHNPGWHWVLASLHRLADWDARMLVAFSVVTLFLVFAGSPLPWLKRPEAWLASLAIAMLVFPYFADRVPGHSWGRVAVSCLVALLLFSGVASDRDGRWSQSGRLECLDASRSEHAGWVPDPGGVLYCVNLSVFYETFFQNPHGNWRYVLGFEPSFMRPQDLVVYQELWRSLNAIRACAPWIRQMTPADRLVLLGGPRPQPAIHALQWYYAASNTWVGRLPRPTGALPPLPASR